MNTVKSQVILLAGRTTARAHVLPSVLVHVCSNGFWVLGVASKAQPVTILPRVGLAPHPVKIHSHIYLRVVILSL
jgi:hypothetical protein